jgi:ketosteroid isomerase-like protein
VTSAIAASCLELPQISGIFSLFSGHAQVTFLLFAEAELLGPETYKEIEMHRATQKIVGLVVLLAVNQTVSARADDMSDAKAASAAFYNSLSTLDDGTAMSAVFAQTPYITFVGPRTKEVIVGWPALKKYFVKSNALFKKRETQIANSTMHVSGSFAWEVGRETGENQMADGKKLPVDWVVTNIFEKQADGKWLMVSHHVQPGAK